jgi:hypothetical protein
VTSPERRKALKLAYKLTPPPMGLFAIRNRVTGRLLVATSLNLTAAINRHRVELQRGVHRHRDLMADWRQYGEAQFTFEVLERIEPRDDPGFDPVAALEARFAAWRAGSNAELYS